jgi:[pyruvate, water dikinase]-phosphate phosphotransferase / [pyruvate, water dikinase] kinase
MRDIIHIYLLSDSTGETVNSVARAGLAQFSGVDVIEHRYTLLRSVAQLKRVFAVIDVEPGPIIYTLVKKEMRNEVRSYCDEKQLPCISVLGNLITQMSAYIGIATSSTPGKQHVLNDNYFTKVEAINFALAHDDGQNTWNLDAADIVLVGPSRTSKSPTCVYLANRGLRAANVPYVQECPLPDTLFELTTPLIIGLTIDVERLFQIRESRLATLGQMEESSYIDKELIKQEVLSSKRLFHKHGWPVIDVTRRSVEETAAHIIQIYERYRNDTMRESL